MVFIRKFTNNWNFIGVAVSLTDLHWDKAMLWLQRIQKIFQTSIEYSRIYKLQTVLNVIDRNIWNGHGPWEQKIWPSFIFLFTSRWDPKDVHLFKVQFLNNWIRETIILKQNHLLNDLITIIRIILLALKISLKVEHFQS